MPKVFIIPHYHYKNQFVNFLDRANKAQESFEFYLLPLEIENEAPLKKTVADYTEILWFLDNQKRRMGLNLENLLIAFHDGVITASDRGLTNLFIAGANREDPYPCTAAVSLQFISWGILEQKYDYSLQRHALFHLVMCTLVGVYTKVAEHHETYGCLLDFNEQLVDFNRKLQMGYYLCSTSQNGCYAAMQSEPYGKSIIRLGEVLREYIDREEVIKIIQNIQQYGKYNVNIGQGTSIRMGDTYQNQKE
ncbi:MAG TPA: hypothetical protein V6D15_02765 [Oculatellaceae cyanobacterium]|jgi:hypothetical protein